MRIAAFALGISLLSATAAHAITCPPDAVPVGPVCVDKYEASVWSVPNPTTGNATLVDNIKNGTATLGDLLAGGATQVGCNYIWGYEHEEFPPNFPSNGNWSSVVAPPAPPTPGVYAASVPGVLPTACITWFQAAQACHLSDKRLVTNAEWQVAAAGTPDPGTDNGSTDCNTNTGAPRNTGSRSACVSNWGVSDMVGNVWEWVADWVPHSGPCSSWGEFSEDRMCLSGVNSTATGPGALTRGGYFWHGSDYAGVFAVNGHDAPQKSFGSVGFRCGR